MALNKQLRTSSAYLNPQVAKRELALECDYRWELASQQRFKALVSEDTELQQYVHVPAAVPELSTRSIMTSEWVQGVPIDKVRGGCNQWSGTICVCLCHRLIA